MSSLLHTDTQTIGTQHRTVEYRTCGEANGGVARRKGDVKVRDERVGVRVGVDVEGEVGFEVELVELNGFEVDRLLTTQRAM